MNAIELARARADAERNKREQQAKGPQKLDSSQATPGKLVESGKEKHNPTKVYFSRAPHSRFIFSDCTDLIFAFGRAEVGPKTHHGTFSHPTVADHKDNGKELYLVYQRELDAILGRQGNIYTQESIAPEDPKPPVPGATEAEVAEAERKLIGVNGRTEQEVGPITVGAGLPTDPNASSLDLDLQRAMMDKNSGGGQAGGITQIQDSGNPGAASSVSG